MIRKKSPCKNCKLRHEGCHSGCVDYMSWKAKLDELRERERMEREAVNTLIESCVRMKKEKRR